MLPCRKSRKKSSSGAGRPEAPAAFKAESRYASGASTHTSGMEDRMAARNRRKFVACIYARHRIGAFEKLAEYGSDSSFVDL